jgi:endonuclease YncB( thermonuclease family)
VREDPGFERRPRRRGRHLLIAVTSAVTIAVVLIVLMTLAQAQQPAAAPQVGATVADIPSRPGDAFPLTVGHVFDGDTIEAQMQVPNDVVTTSRPIRIRLIGIDTPEGTPTPECWAEEARDHLRRLLPEGSTVWAAPDVDSWDRYDRRLFNLWTGDGRFVNHELVAAGDAEAMSVRPNVAFEDLLAGAQSRAEASGAGQWGACRR